MYDKQQGNCGQENLQLDHDFNLIWWKLWGHLIDEFEILSIV